MKLISCGIVIVFFAFSTYGQDMLIYGKREGAKGVNLGLTGGLNSTWLFNKNVTDAGDHLDYFSTFGGNVGLNIFLVFNEKSAISLGLLYAGHNQKYQGTLSNTLGDEVFSYENFIRLKYLDIPLLYRMQSPKGPYLEIGPQFSILLSAKEDFSSTPLIFFPNYSDKNFKNNFNSVGVGAILGFGVDFDAADNIIITAGMRFGYSFTDATEEFSISEINMLLIQDQLSYTSIISHLNNDGKFSYEPTKRALGGLVVGLAYKIP
jgi:hypothetical protein